MYQSNIDSELQQKENIQIYPELSLVELIRQIVFYGDTNALNELHENRSVFQYQDRRGLLMVDFLVRLKERPVTKRWCGYSQITIDRAFDLALSKFLYIPQEIENKSNISETKGTDCRYYFEAYLEYVSRKIQKSMDILEIELVAAKLLETFVSRHFYLSCLEWRRREHKMVRRICWELNGHCLSLWMPMELTVKQCRQWLKDNIQDEQIEDNWERERVQEIIDRRLSRKKILSFANLQEYEKVSPEPSYISLVVKEDILANGLAETLANEKADCIELQRPAIRLLGKDKLKALIHKTFDNLMNHGKDYQNILSEFSLSKSTYNRFAGNK